MSTIKKIGHGGAYSYAKDAGYTGTKEQFAEGLKKSAEYTTNAKASADAAAKSAENAQGSQTAAETAEKAAQSYAVGGTSTRTGEDTDNAKSYAEAAKASADSAAGSVKEITENKATIDAVHADLATIKAVNENKTTIDAVGGNLDAIKASSTNAANAAASEKAAKDANALAQAAASTVSATDLETIVTNYYAMRRTGKKFSVQIPIFSKNPSSACSKTGINADFSWSPATDTHPGSDDYEKIPMFQWIHAIYKRNTDGSPYPVAIEGTALYDSLLAERKCDVGAMQMSFYIAIDGSHTADGYNIMTISDLPFEGSYIWSECKKADKSELPWCIGSAYISSIGADGFLHSLPEGNPARFQSYNNMCTNYPKKGDGYQGAGAERHLFQWIFELIKGATKSSSALFTGCSGYNFQYNCAAGEENVKRVLVTADQSKNFAIGGNVMLGHAASDGSKDRGSGSSSDIVEYAKVLSIENVTVNGTAYAAINLDLDKAITTTTDVVISSTHWAAGSTDAVIGHRDGSLESNTDSKHPYRVQGREYMVGGYEVASDTIMSFDTDYGKNVYVYPKGTKHTANGKSGATLIGKIPGQKDGADFYVGDEHIDLDTGSFFPITPGGNSENGVGDIHWAGGKTTSGDREYLMGGNLWDGAGSTGFGSLSAGYWLGYAGWFYLSAD